MEILAPLSDYSEIIPLINAGADKFYCGIIPEEWQKFRNNININARPNSFSLNFEQLKRSYYLIKKNKKELSVVFNSQFYTSEQIRLIGVYIKKLKKIGIRDFTIANIGLLYFLNKNLKNVKLNLSTVGSLLNNLSIDFYRRFGVTGVTLPLTDFSHIKSITKDNKGTEYTVFILNNGCRNYHPFCFFGHKSKPISKGAELSQKLLNKNRKMILKFSNLIPGHVQQKYIQPCNTNYDFKMIISQENKNNDIIKKRLNDFFGLKCSIMRHLMCGTCTINELETIGVKNLKISGREMSLKQKVLYTKYVKECINVASHSNRKALCKKLHRDYFGYKCIPSKCYFPGLRI